MSATADMRDWQSDDWGTFNDAPPVVVDMLGGLLESLRTLPAFEDARCWLFDRLQVPAGGAILEAGCGNGIALPDLVAAFGPDAHVTGIDPTTGFVVMARERAAQLGAANARYEVGDIRALSFADGAYDAAFCEKILMHVRPVQRAVDEMTRVVRPGGRVGVTDWYPHFAISTTRPALATAYNDIFGTALNRMIIANLADHFRAASLQDVTVQPFLAYAQSLDEHPGWRALMVEFVPIWVQGGLIAEADARDLVADLQALDARGAFSASFVVYAAVGTKPA